VPQSKCKPQNMQAAVVPLLASLGEKFFLIFI